MSRSFIVMCAFALVLTACAGATTTAVAPTASESEQVVAATESAPVRPQVRSVRSGSTEPDIVAFCAGLDVVTDIVLDADQIAQGSVDEQLDVQLVLEENITIVAEEIGEDFPDLSEALSVIGETAVAIQTEDAPFDADALQEAAEVTLDYFNGTCVVEAEGDTGVDYTAAECPAPETLEANGFECDEFGNLYPIGGECPAPETLEAEGFGCDEFGNLFPLDSEPMDTVEECPAPETLEAEGLACDEFGNIYPIADGSDFEGDPYYDDGYVDDGYDDGYGDDGYVEEG